eukprot:TRINITY_DN12891_c0_g1_i7.p1 TRINITY_DN12891_c0_g1~~TRINITY_DN12891_c0_g1_i7.p1  ORF type:complete len:139 (-),score=1.10 TRINITY_DN12891_c0_g1_i7:19-435(-)
MSTHDRWALDASYHSWLPTSPLPSHAASSRRGHVLEHPPMYGCCPGGSPAPVPQLISLIIYACIAIMMLLKGHRRTGGWQEEYTIGKGWEDSDDSSYGYSQAPAQQTSAPMLSSCDQSLGRVSELRQSREGTGQEPTT